jgi:hypothetical protein
MVYVAVKRRLQPGDKMAGGRGNKLLGPDAAALPGEEAAAPR